MIVNIGFLAGTGLALGKLVFCGDLSHVVLAEVLPEIAAFEASEVVIPYSPLSSTLGAVPGDLAKTDGGAEDMADAVHPGSFAALEIGIDDSDPVVNFLEGETVYWG